MHAARSHFVIVLALGLAVWLLTGGQRPARLDGGPGDRGDGSPSAFDFLFHAFVIGTSLSVSRVNTLTRELSAGTLVHSIAYFSFNAGLIALAVNAVMTFAG